MSVDSKTQAATPPGAMAGEPRLRPGKPIARIGAALTAFSSARSAAVTVGLAGVAILSGLFTYLVLTQAAPFSPEPKTVGWLLAINLVIAASLALLICYQIVRLFRARRRGHAGAQIHSRLVAMFSLIAILPSILLAGFSTFVLDLGIDSWFSETVRTAVTSSRQVAGAYLREHQRNIILDVTLMANDLNKAAPWAETDRQRFNAYVGRQALLRNLGASAVLDGSGRAYAAFARPDTTLELPNLSALEAAQDGAIHFLESEEVVPASNPEVSEGTAEDARGAGEIRAILKLEAFKEAYLFVSRPVQPLVLDYHQQSLAASEQYAELERSRGDIKITFLSLFLLVALLMLLAAIWVGFWLADRLVSPIARLISAADQVSEGDLNARVKVAKGSGELTALGHTFNRMTSELSSQRDELVEANRQYDERRRFTEAVLSGVSAGVIGLDHRGHISLINRSAATLFGLHSAREWGEPLGAIVPALAPLVDEAIAAEGRRQDTVVARQIDLDRDGTVTNLTVRITREASTDERRGYVVTIDDITELVTAQRNTAWADVARRIAHEIKNPLTPIQLSAERLRRKYLKEIQTDPDIFEQCTETIIRQVNDIGRMADEFSSFARMPAPVMADTDLSDIVRHAVFMQRVAQPGITFDLVLPGEAVQSHCDGRLVAQSLTNLIKNAVEAIDEKRRIDGDEAAGTIKVRLAASGFHVMIEVTDDGIGLPKGADRQRLTEPYMTTRKKGTGLGLAIVRKVVEEHGGTLILDDAPGEGGGAMVRLVFPQGLGASKGAGNPADGLSDAADIDLAQFGQSADNAAE
ncbi:MAG: PAS domain-containing sensor histidine kinase [Pseudomonadota bacterium]